MINVKISPEPAGFEAAVRSKGTAFLSSVPPGEKIVFRGKEYWRAALPDLHIAYKSICAYTCHWIPMDVGSDTVEHFVAKSTHPSQSYEWNNYRLVCGRMNGRKGAHSDVIDPFLVDEGMFELKFPSLLVIPGEGVIGDKRALVETTIMRLNLNGERSIKARLHYVMGLRNKHVTMAYLNDYAPFIHREINRQDIASSLETIMDY